MTKKETIGIIIILALIASASFYNFKIALRRSRDAQRKSDVRTISDALKKYNDEFGFYPAASADGRIVACKGDIDPATGIPTFVPCEWGKNGIYDISDPNYPPYIKVLPIDPDSKKGLSYHYLSNSKRFQLLAALEGSDEAEYDIKILKRNIGCGDKICNFGLASGDTPLDKSIEEYENELMEKELMLKKQMKLK